MSDQLAVGNWCVSQSRALAAVRTLDRSRRPAPTPLAVGGVGAVGDRIVVRARTAWRTAAVGTCSGVLVCEQTPLRPAFVIFCVLLLPLFFNFLSSHPPSVAHYPFPSRCRLGREPCRLLSDPQPLVASAQNAKVKARNVTCKQADDVAGCVTLRDEQTSGAPGVSVCSVRTGVLFGVHPAPCSVGTGVLFGVHPAPCCVGEKMKINKTEVRETRGIRCPEMLITIYQTARRHRQHVTLAVTV
jgi:hypothetical protein